MKKKRKFAFVVLALVLTLCFATVAQASWYGYTSATFSNSVAGSARSYDGNNVGLNWGASTHNSSPNHVSNSNGFFVALERKSLLGWTRVGSVNKPRAGADGATWTNVGPGTYRFYFWKSNDGTTQYVEDIEMFSW